MKNKPFDGGRSALLCNQKRYFPENLYLHNVSFDEPEALLPCRDPRINPPGARG